MPNLGQCRAEPADAEIGHAERRSFIGRFALALLLCFGFTTSALAQSGMLAAPSAAAGNFDFFVLSLSWSPGFCAAEGNAKAPRQCAAGTGLGFVVHGLWPQFEHGFPSNCALAPRPPSRAALAKAAELYPDEGLARHEWREHGTCTGESPDAYFSDVRRAHDAINLPAMFRSAQTARFVPPAAVARAFLDANPRLRPGMLAVTCRRNILQEVRFCLTKDLRGFRTCPEVVRTSCRSQQISVPPLR